MIPNNAEFIWVEKWRPLTLDDCILPSGILSTFKEFASKGEIPNLLFSGSAGVGKTTLARALASDLGATYLMINASEESGIDVLRTKIRDFASSLSLMADQSKVVILDEADGLTPATQNALKAFIEEFSVNCRFILTCNHKNKIIPPLHSRLSLVEFRLTKEDRPRMASKFMKRVLHILTSEQVPYDEKVVAGVVMKYFPDYRRCLNELQRYSASGSIDEGVLASVGDADYSALIKTLKNKDFKGMREWVVNNMDNEVANIFRRSYEMCLTEVNEVPQAILILADYSYKSSFAADAELNITACMTELMASCTFK
jgi:replication factor C small subunit